MKERSRVHPAAWRLYGRPWALASSVLCKQRQQPRHPPGTNCVRGFPPTLTLSLQALRASWYKTSLTRFFDCSDRRLLRASSFASIVFIIADQKSPHAPTAAGPIARKRARWKIGEDVMRNGRVAFAIAIAIAILQFSVL